MIVFGEAVHSAGASGVPTGQPLTVQSTSLVQTGQDLVWQVELAQPFSPAALARDGRRLCLLIERGANGSVISQVCLAGPRSGAHTPRLIYVPVVAPVSVRAGAIAATVTRSSDRELTASFLPASVGLGYRGLRWQVSSTLSAPGCSSATEGAPGCAALFPATPTFERLHTPQLVGCEPSGPDWVFHGPSDQREIALTFDDGPWGEPPSSQFVSLLAREGVPATFFEIGDEIATYDPHGTVERQMLADGDMIGDHTWSHPDLVGLPAAEQREQISKAAAAIRQATGFEPCLFRAPYGAVDPSLLQTARSMGFTTIQWDVDPRDWALPGVTEIIDNVDANAHNGAIVEEHFGGGPRYETLDALPREIADLRARGYQLVTLTEMLGYKLVYR
ncbi:MAG TPA: polysaccharide deacetylase family protein [Solirubrobacteraceae bacterium]|nr:polysaccharide deacetylase family protein [Solirubrobacteraceae bacterium]